MPCRRPRRRRPTTRWRGVDTTGIDPAALKRFETLDCAKDAGVGAQDAPDKQYVGCSQDGSTKFVLDKAAVTGTSIDSASLRRRPDHR
ncbi:hypothetical protein GCM10018952_72940 [Streptosporangium vulgare]